jgi:hypothetical protein
MRFSSGSELKILIGLFSACFMDSEGEDERDNNFELRFGRDLDESDIDEVIRFENEDGIDSDDYRLPSDDEKKRRNGDRRRK